MTLRTNNSLSYIRRSEAKFKVCKSLADGMREDEAIGR